MDSKRKASIALLLSINLIFHALTANATHNCNNNNNNCNNNCNNNTPPPNNNNNTPPPPSRNPVATCPRNALQLGVCADLLGGLLGIVIGNPPTQPCCSLIQGLVDLEAAVCLCTAIRANVLGINLNVLLSISLILNACGKNYPPGFVCPI